MEADQALESRKMM